MTFVSYTLPLWLDAGLIGFALGLNALFDLGSSLAHGLRAPRATKTA